MRFAHANLPKYEPGRGECFVIGQKNKNAGKDKEGRHSTDCCSAFLLVPASTTQRFYTQRIHEEEKRGL